MTNKESQSKLVSKDTIIDIQRKLIASLKDNIKTKNKLIKLFEGERLIPEFDEAITNLQANLRMFRAKKGLSQTEMSPYIDIDNGYISKLESGNLQNPSLKIMLRFCHFFKCTLSEIVRG